LTILSTDKNLNCPRAHLYPPVIADLVLQDQEKKALNTLTFHTPFYIHYVDDIAMRALAKKKQKYYKFSIHFISDYSSRLKLVATHYLDIIIVILLYNILGYDWYTSLLSPVGI